MQAVTEAVNDWMRIACRRSPHMTVSFGQPIRSAKQLTLGGPAWPYQTCKKAAAGYILHVCPRCMGPGKTATISCALL